MLGRSGAVVRVRTRVTPAVGVAGVFLCGAVAMLAVVPVVLREPVTNAGLYSYPVVQALGILIGGIGGVVVAATSAFRLSMAAGFIPHYVQQPAGDRSVRIGAPLGLLRGKVIDMQLGETAVFRSRPAPGYQTLGKWPILYLWEVSAPGKRLRRYSLLRVFDDRQALRNVEGELVAVDS